MIQLAEKMLGPYEWGIYDILILPPSFSFSGMEHPCVNFVSPALVTGDKTGTIIIAHELAHSWSGNLVTCKNFEHLWVNEGLTTFIDGKIKSRLEKKPSLSRGLLGSIRWTYLNNKVFYPAKFNYLNINYIIFVL